MLTEDQKAELRRVIEESIAELKGIIEHLEHDTQPEEVDGSVGRLSRMDSLVNRGTKEMALKEAVQKLARLENKLKKLDEPDFGRCVVCGTWIPWERLLAAPDRSACVACAKPRA